MASEDKQSTEVTCQQQNTACQKFTTVLPLGKSSITTWRASALLWLQNAVLATWMSTCCCAHPLHLLPCISQEKHTRPATLSQLNSDLGDYLHYARQHNTKDRTCDGKVFPRRSRLESPVRLDALIAISTRTSHTTRQHLCGPPWTLGPPSADTEVRLLAPSRRRRPAPLAGRREGGESGPPDLAFGRGQLLTHNPG